MHAIIIAYRYRSHLSPCTGQIIKH